MEPPPMILPLDLIAEILVRLPVNSILRSKCVCQSWNALISQPHFVHKHLLHSTADLNRHRVLVAYHNHSPSLPEFPPNLLKNYFLPSLLHSSSSTTPASSHLDLPPCDALNTNSLSIIGACHGMLCLSMEQAGLVLWNPSIRSFKMLPPITWSRYSYCLVGFGYDHFSRSYKAVSVQFYESLGGYETQVMLHTLGTDSWRPIQRFPTVVAEPGDRVKFAGGTFNWLVWYDRHTLASSLGSCIVSLDPMTEGYRQLLLPDRLVPPVNSCQLEIDELKGCLCLVSVRDIDCSNHVHEVWVMKEYGKEESWTKLFSVPFIQQCFMGCFLAPEALWISDEGEEILLKEETELTVYNSKCGTSEYHDIKTSGSFISAAAYAESLVSPCCF